MAINNEDVSATLLNKEVFMDMSCRISGDWRNLCKTLGLSQGITIKLGVTYVLPSKFCDFLQQNFSEILSCNNDNGYYKDFEVILQNDDKYTTLIGLNWELGSFLSI
ncbi:hypothetical protein MTR_5g018660 [Medicago truncatula]|uniref:Uncharacterized protein n=1 Tax=Medicago truncatula TaxID=3880 RepID=G7K9H4_MEDTR|nr:hypothetical protein MTR_5g018660 [Medicago truncatula]